MKEGVVSMNLRRSIRVACAMQGLSFVELENRAGFKPKFISAVVKNNSASLKTVQKIASSLELNMSDFIALGE